MSKRLVSTIIVSFLIVCSPLLASAQITTADEPQINVLWILDDSGNNAHAYRVTFSDNASYEVDIEIDQIRNGSQIPTYFQQEWKSIDSNRVVDVYVNTTLLLGDEVHITVQINSVDGQIIVPVIGEREITIGTWNQPMDDHEIMLSTVWDLDQAYDNDDGNQGFFLDFEGQGWQKREGNIVNSWELGNGSLITLESTNGSTNNLSLILDSIWKNETIVGGVLTTQIFDARGHGLLSLVDDDGETQTLSLIHI